MHFSVQEALLFLLPLLSPALAADCFTVTGINTLALSRTGLSAEIDSTCADLRSGVPRTSRTSGDTLFSVRATSSAATYEFCESALENIATQCGGDVLGKFDFDFGGQRRALRGAGAYGQPRSAVSS